PELVPLRGGLGGLGSALAVVARANELLGAPRLLARPGLRRLDALELRRQLLIELGDSALVPSGRRVGHCGAALRLIELAAYLFQAASELDAPILGLHLLLRGCG